MSKERQCPSRARLPPSRHSVVQIPVSSHDAIRLFAVTLLKPAVTRTHTTNQQPFGFSLSVACTKTPPPLYSFAARAHSSLERPSSEATLPQLGRPDVSTQRLPPPFPLPAIVRACRSNWLKASGRGSHLPSHKGNWTTETRNGFLPN